jgi:hypothetical protein
MSQKSKSPFKTVSENLPFYPNMKDESEHIHDPFIGMYDGSSILGDSPKPEEQIPVYTFAKIDTGEKFYITQSYAIKKCVEAAKKEFDSLVDIVFQFIFKEKTQVNGKPFNVFTTGYCTLEQYEASLKDEVKVEALVKAKAKK